MTVWIKEIGFTCHSPLDLLAVPIDIFLFLFLHTLDWKTNCVSAFSYSQIFWLFTNASSHAAVKESFDIHIYCNIEFKFSFTLFSCFSSFKSCREKKKSRYEHRSKRNHWFELKSVTKEAQAVRIISFGLRCVCICDEGDGWKEMKVEREKIYACTCVKMCMYFYIYVLENVPIFLVHMT